MSLTEEMQLTLDDVLERDDNPPAAEIPDVMKGSTIGTVPNPLLRSSLFGVVKNGCRNYEEKTELASWGEIGILFTGLRLNQSDLDVWIELCADQAGGVPTEPIEFTGRDFLQRLGKRASKRDYDFLKASLDRLLACAVHVVYDEWVYAGSFLSNYIRHEDTKRFEVELNPRMTDLFGVGHTYVDLSVRRNFRSGMDKWLQLFVESHRDGVSIGMNKLRELCGSTSKYVRSFRQQFKNSCKRLDEAGVLSKWSIDDQGVVRMET